MKYRGVNFGICLAKLQKNTGGLILSNYIPIYYWGDTLRVHRRTGEIVGVIDLSQIYQLKFDKPVPHDSVANLLRRFEDIEYAEGPLIGYTTSVEPNDHGFHQNSPHNPEPYRWSFDALDAPLAWGLTKGSSDIRIGIHDGFSNKINTLHPELVNKVVWIHPTILSHNLYGGHGIQVAGVAGAETDNSAGIASLGWNTSLMLAPMNNYPAITQLTDNGADIINFSWIYYHSQTLENHIQYALQNGVILTAGAGNGPDNLDKLRLPIPSVVYPAAYNFGSLGRVIAVSATWVENGTEDFITGYNYSPGTDPINNPGTAFIDFSATGANIIGLRDTVYNETQHLWAGTSFAAPKVAAIAALILSINSTITPNDLFDILHATSEKIGANSYDSNGWNQYMGYGRVNAYQALKHTIEYYGATLGYGTSLVKFPLWEDIAFHEDVYLAGGSTLTISAHETVTLSAASGTVTIGAPPPLAKVVEDVQGLVRAGLPHTDSDPEPRPEQFLLLPNYPNPFNPSTTIRYELPGNSDVRLEVYDMLGRRVALLVNETRQAGTHQAVFDASALSSGVYIYRLQAGGLVQTRKMLLIK